jgi:hypothetical protein
MGIFWNRHEPGERSIQRPHARRRQLEFTVLEDRRLLAIGTITATAVPNLLIPPNNGHFDTVTVSGTFVQVITDTLPGHPTTPPDPAALAKIDATLDSEPVPDTVLVQVTDQYRRDEPRFRAEIKLVNSTNVFTPPSKGVATAEESVVRHFSYTFTVKLQARRSSTQPEGRHYYINVAAADADDASSTTVAVLAPLDPNHPAIPHAPKATAKVK